jgi:linoleate 10R-lipoxygenase
MLMSRLPDGGLKSKLQNGIVELLWHDLLHPPPTYLGEKHVWRTADGSYNNVNIPDMGKAGNFYSRSVQQKNPLPPSQLPDPGLLFDSLLKREKVQSISLFSV